MRGVQSQLHTLQERAAWMQNFTDRFVKLAAALGYTNAEIEQVQLDNTMMQFLAETDVEEAAFSKANT